MVEEIDRAERERENAREAEEAEFTSGSLFDPLPDAAELFYPISPEAIMEVVRFYVVHAEKELKKP